MRSDALRRERLELSRLIERGAAGEEHFAHLVAELCESGAVPLIGERAVHGVADRLVIGIDQHAAWMHVAVAAHDRRVVAKKTSAVLLRERRRGREAGAHREAELAL